MIAPSKSRTPSEWRISTDQRRTLTVLLRQDCLLGSWPETALAGGKIVNRWVRIVGAEILFGTLLPTLLISQTTQNTKTPGPYALIGITRALDEGHSVDSEAGYVRHLEWHRQVNDPFNWYSYSVSASTEQQRWIIYATFGRTAAELSNPVPPAEG
jgi:hypothetical protein